MSTKKRIIDAALTLFAENGYNGTSVEQIAEAVGIKAPSLYKHFKGKEDILNTLIDTAEARYEEHFGSEKNIGTIPPGREEFIAATMEKIRFTMEDPMIRKLRMFMVQEQFRSERLGELASRHQADGLLGMYQKILEGMMASGLCRTDDPALLALELTAPVVVYISKVDRKPEYEAEALEIIEKHVRHFCGEYFVNDRI